VGVVPPFTGIGVKVTGDEVTHNIVPGLDDMPTSGATTGLLLTFTITGADSELQPLGMVINTV
jgi:hypothetical protein